MAAPKHWMLDKLTGVFVSTPWLCLIYSSTFTAIPVNGLLCHQAPRPSTGPHKLRECLPLIIFLRNRLKYALTGDEVKKICMQRFIKIDGKVRTDVTYPAGFMGEWVPEVLRPTSAKMSWLPAAMMNLCVWSVMSWNNTTHSSKKFWALTTPPLY